MRARCGKTPVSSVNQVERCPHGAQKPAGRIPRRLAERGIPLARLAEDAKQRRTEGDDDEADESDQAADA